MKILDRYIRHTVIFSTFLVSAVVIGMQSFLALIQQLQYVGQHGYTLWQAFLYVPMQLPAQFYQLFPIAGFLGALIGLTRLSSTSQLIVMRASGVSIKRIAWSVLKAAVLMIVVVTTMGEGAGPLLQQHSELARQKTLSSSNRDSLLDSVWLHQANGFTHISRLTHQNTMLDITRYRFGPDGRLVRVIDAKSGRLVNGQWKLSHLKKTIFLKDRIEVKTQQHSDFHVAFQPNLQLQMSIDSAEQTMMDLYRTIEYRRSTGLGVNRFVFSFWQRLLQPATTVIMICLAVPFVFGSFCSASMGFRIIAGVLIGFVFYMLNQLFGPITLVYQFPPLLAALIPTCLFSLIALILILRTR